MNDIELESEIGTLSENASYAESVDLKARTNTNTLGSVQLRNPITNDVILVPAPSKDPNDPLNWYVYPLLNIGYILLILVFA